MDWMKNWFSNMLPFECPVVYQGLTYKTPEHLYQALKLPKEDLAGRAEIAAMDSPYVAKRRSRTKDLRRLGRLRKDWEQVQLSVMEFVLQRKFAEGTGWLERLVATGSEELVERNTWHDRFWGQCFCDRCQGAGRNELGKLLMKLRDEAVKAAA